MSPRSVVAFGTTGIVLALTVLALSWHSSSAAPAGPADGRATPPTPDVQVVMPGGPADTATPSLATPLSSTGLAAQQ
jgi:hypothetical protein